MSTPVVYNGVTYNVPAFGDTGYAQGFGNMSAYWIALATGSLQQTGGSFILSNEVNFGPSFGLMAHDFTSITPNPATAGIVRLAVTDSIDWRNNANSANLALAVNGSDQLTFNGTPIGGGGSGVTSITGTANQVIASASTGAVTLSLPQSIATTSIVEFQQVEVGNPSTNSGVLTFANSSNANTVHLTPGVTSPSSYTLTLPVAVGTSGQVLTASDNVGTLGWTTPTVSPAAPTGAAMLWFTSSPPAGWIFADGSSYTTASQPGLFALYSYSFGGSGANFNVPNLTNNVPIGAGSIAALGSTVGSQTHSLTVSEIPAGLMVTDPGHTHGVTDPGHVHIVLGSGTGTNTQVTTVSSGTSNHNNTTASATGVTVNSATTGISVGGGGTAMSLVQPSFGVNYIIKT